MSTVKANNYYDASGGSNAQLYGVASPPSGMGFRNRIINGDMRIDQRNAGASVTPATSPATYTLDRWKFQVSQASKLTTQQNAGSVTPPVGFVNYLGVTSSSAYSVAAGDYFVVQQNIEGLNISDFAWGTASAVTATLSFRVYSSLTGTFGGAIQNSGSTRSYPFTFSVASANTWTIVSVTIPGDTSGTWLTTNGIGIAVYFGLGVGSTYSGTAGAWAGTNYLSATGATSVVGTNGATFYITGVQLEAGTVASPFERRDYGRELMMCQRYYEQSETLATFVGQRVGIGVANNYVQGFAFLVQKRAAPTVTVYNRAGTANKVEVATTGVSTGGTVSAVNIGVSSVPLLNDSGTAFTSGVGYGWTYIASAEL